MIMNLFQWLIVLALAFAAGKSLIITTLTQSLGTFAVVSLAFGIIFYCSNIPVYLAFVFGGIALILWSKNRSKNYPYAGYRQEVSWIDAVAAKKEFELAKEI